MSKVLQTDERFQEQGAYNHWVETLARMVAPEEDLLEPVFISAQMTVDEFLKTIRAADGYFLDAIEAESLAILGKDNGENSAFVYRRVDATGGRAPLPEGCTLHHVGAVTTTTGRLPLRQGARRSDYTGAPVVIGIIDDGLAYLNRRFTFNNQTRFIGLWQQTLSVLKAGKLQLGDVFYQDAIDNQLEELGLLTESDIYRREWNHRTNASDTRKAMAFRAERYALGARATHGTSMLDHAAGADPDSQSPDPMRGVPLIGVQLPSPVFDDTSGNYLTSHILMGLRWMISVLVELQVRKLVVNLSLGITAGAKDNKDFLAQQIETEVTRASELGIEVHLVLAYGNDFDDNLVAHVTASNNAASLPEILVLPDDHTSSYIEMRRLGEGSLSEVGIAVTPPGAPTQTFPPLMPGQWADIHDAANRLVARLYHDEIVARALVLAIAPTGGAQTAGMRAPCGAWHVAAAGLANGHVLTAQIQRDNRIPSGTLRGRQARFDEQAAHLYDPIKRSLTALGGAISHSGTNSAYTGPPRAWVTQVGAARQLGARATMEPAPYSSEGAIWSGGEPDHSLLVERGTWLSGVNGTGTSSGSTERSSGTSVAAAFEIRRQALGLEANTKTSKPDPVFHARLGSLIYELQD